ncbi:hypothetical protein BGZ94_004966 [Podila epigama]|nr:hypothetical protein BGZ94_004966 [Podila epigama]
MGRWAHSLRKYRLTAKKGSTFGGPRTHRDAAFDNTTNLARVPLVDFDFDREYYGTVMVGEPPQAFKIDFDTGSSQFIISSKDCTDCSGTTRYDTTASLTFRENGQPWHITYGDLSQAEGILGHDKVRIDDIEVQDQQLALVTNESQGFDEAIDGIMGLSFGALSSSIASTRTVFENMMEQRLVEKGIFSFYLGKASQGGGGEVIFGGMDMSWVEPGEELTFTPVTRPKYWQINVENVLVNGKVIKYISKDRETLGEADRKRANVAGIVDTGTTLMIVPSRLAQLIHRKVTGAAMVGPSWAVPCDLVRQSRDGSKVELQIEGKRFGIPFEDLVREPTDVEGMCFSGIQPSSGTFMIIGDVFIKNNYVVFDQENRRVGFAPLRQPQSKKKMEAAKAKGKGKAKVKSNH